MNATTSERGSRRLALRTLFAIATLAAAILTASSVHAAQLTSFVQGSTLAYDLNGTNSYLATIGLPLNACAQSFSLDALPGEKTSTALTPIDAVLITDVSGSMGNPISSTDPTPKIDLVKSVDQTFVNDFIVPGSSIHRVALVSYNQQATLRSGLTNDATTLDSTIQGYVAGGNTCISCAVQVANQQLDSNGRPNALKIIILMTDGLANTELNGQYSVTLAKQQAYALACSDPTSSVNQSFIVNTVAFGSDADTAFLQSIADCSPNGTAYVGTSASQLYAIYTHLAHVTGRSWPTPSVSVANALALNTTGTLTSPASVDGSCPGCTDPLTAIQNALYQCYVDGTACAIPVETTSATPGLLNLTNLDVTYTTGGLIPTASGLICGRLRSCGNGILDPGEQCDSTPGCTANCTLSAPPPGPAPVCGNGIQEPGEQCDQGSANKPLGYDCGLGPGQRCTYCTTGCQLVTKFEPGNAQAYVCGNGLLEPGEQCDAGKLNGVACTPGAVGCTYCSNSCQLVKLNATAQTPICGNAVVEPGEQCDRGTQNVPAGTTCDPGSGSCSVCIQGTCQLQTFSATPTPPVVPPGTGTCGDGVRETPNSTGQNEQCDFGSSNKPAGFSCGLQPGQSCTWCQVGTCQLHHDTRPIQQCGDGIVEGTEQCDAGAQNGVACTPGYGSSCTYCSPTCTNVTLQGGYCGDGTVQSPQEQCDPLSPVPLPNGEVCSSSCLVENPPQIVPQGFNPGTGCVDLNAYTHTVLDASDLNTLVQQGDGPYTFSVVSNGGLGQGSAPGISAEALASGYFDLDGVFPDTSAPSTYRPTIKVTGGNGLSTSICIDLSVSHLPTIQPTDPNTLLLITKGTITSGYWTDEISGHVWTWGPYRIDVRVYQR